MQTSIFQSMHNNNWWKTLDMSSLTCYWYFQLCNHVEVKLSCIFALYCYGQGHASSSPCDCIAIYGWQYILLHVVPGTCTLCTNTGKSMFSGNPDLWITGSNVLPHFVGFRSTSSIAIQICSLTPDCSIASWSLTDWRTDWLTGRHDLTKIDIILTMIMAITLTEHLERDV